MNWNVKYVRKQIYPLQPKQQKAADTVKTYRLYGGAKGGGKSYWLRSEAARQALSAPGITGLILRRKLPDVEKNFLYPMQREVPLTAFKYDGQKHIIKWHNGSTTELGFCRNMIDILRYQGLEYDYIGIEEVTQWTEEEFDTLMGSLRSTKPGVIPNFFGTANPGGIGHAWVKKRWITREPSEAYDLSDYAFIGAKFDDNPILMKADPNYIKRLNALPEKMRRALRDGDWDIFEGQYFEEFRQDIHVVAPFYPKNVKKRLISFDYWYTAPSAVYWMAQLYDGTIVVYRELYVTKHTYKQLAAKIVALTWEDEMEEIGGNVFADPAIFAKNESTGLSAEDDMREKGLQIFPADNVRVQGWQTFREALQIYDDPNTHQVRARLQICSNCTELIRTIPIQQHDKRNVEDLDTTLEDHAPDGVRYGLREFELGEIDLEYLLSANQAMMKKNVQNSQIWIKYWQNQKPNQTPDNAEYEIELDDGGNSVLDSDF